MMQGRDRLWKGAGTSGFWQSDNSPWSAISGSASNFPGRIAILSPGQPPLTYGDLSKIIRRDTSALRDHAIGRESRIAVVLPNSPVLATTILSVSSIACCAPLSPQLTIEEYQFELSDLRCSGLITTGEMNSPIHDAAEGLGIDIIPIEGLGPTLSEFSGDNETGRNDEPFDLWRKDICLIMHTSGTTARPKIVPLSRDNLSYSVGRISESLTLTPGDRCLNVMPLFHVHGLIGCLFASLASGGSIVCSPGFSKRDFFSWIHEFEPTWYSAVPAIQEAVYRQGVEMNYTGEHRLRFIRSCSSPLSPVLAGKIENLFSTPVIEAYGMSEATHQISVNPLPPGIRKPGSVGLPAGCEVAILDSGNHHLPTGKTGEISIKGLNVFNGYERNPAANTASFTGGWFRTGDLGYLDAEGYLFITGRIKEIINKGGEKVAPREVEEVFLSHPDVSNAVAFGFPHPSLGEDIALAVVPVPGKMMTVSQLRYYALQRLTPFKVPARFFVVSEIPKGATGKIRRSVLPALFHLTPGEISGNDTRPRDNIPASPRNSLDASLIRIWQDALNIAPVGIDDDFFMLGGTSISAADLIARIFHKTGSSLAPTVLFRTPTIRELSDFISQGRPDTSYLLPVQPRGSNPPIFFIPPSDGSAFFYAPLCEFLGPGQPVYSFMWPGADGREPAPSDIKKLAARFARDITSFQRGNPYILGGFCFGALVALETARQLGKDGTAPGALILLDPEVPLSGPEWTLHHSTRSENLKAEIRLYLERGVRYTCRVQLLRIRRIIEKLRMDHIQIRFHRIRVGHSIAMMNYFVREYPARVCIILSEEFSESEVISRLRKIFTGPSEYHHIAGSQHRELIVFGANEISGIIADEVSRVLLKNPDGEKEAGPDLNLKPATGTGNGHETG
jgi:acyl-CoA synthetase (AMP-forming)/AMP-acid ligase II